MSDSKSTIATKGEFCTGEEIQRRMQSPIGQLEEQLRETKRQLGEAQHALEKAAFDRTEAYRTAKVEAATEETVRSFRFKAYGLVGRIAGALRRFFGSIEVTAVDNRVEMLEAAGLTDTSMDGRAS